MDKETIKKEIDEFVEISEEELEGVMGKLYRCFSYEHLDPSQWSVCSRYSIVASYLYRRYPRTNTAYAAMVALLKSRDEAIRADIDLDKCF
jgi:hypothetical protein